jgi:RES domain-containing protein
LQGEFRIGYTATEPETALAEALASARYYNLPLKTALPRVLVSLRLKAARVLDLHGAGCRRELGLPVEAMTTTDWRRENQNGHEAVTQAWGAAFAAAGFEAAIVPSAASPDGSNVLIFPQNLQASSQFVVEREVVIP